MAFIAPLPIFARRPGPNRAACRAYPRAALAAGSGVSGLPDLSAAAATAVSSALEALPAGTVPSIAVVAATADRDADAVADALGVALGDTPYVGATSCAALLTPAGPVPSGVGVLLLGAPERCVACAAREFGDAGVVEAAKEAAREAVGAVGGDVKMVYMLASPGTEEQALAGVQAVVGEGVPIVGGSAADNDVSGSWSVFGEGKAFGAGVALFVVAGDGVKAGASLKSPYVPTVKEVQVTAAEGRLIRELGGRPAANVLCDMVGDALRGEDVNVIAVMSTRPYALRRDNELLAVHVADVNRADGTVGLFAEVQAGDVLVAMENEGGGNSVDAAGVAIRGAYEAAMENGGLSKPVAGILVYCGGLGIAVGDGLAGNLTGDLAPLPSLPKALVGFTAFGEQGPVGRRAPGKNQHRNLSVGMALLE